MRQTSQAVKNATFLKNIKDSLKHARVLSPAVEAERLIEHFGRLDRLHFFTGESYLKPHQKNAIRRALISRLTGKPLAHILGQADFYGKKFFVSKDTLIPRPETEFLLEETMRVVDELALDVKKGQKTLQILDLGTGSGCLAVCLTIERPDCRMTALDISEKALQIAHKNIVFHGLGQKVQFLRSDLFSRFGKKRKHFWDVIVSNPPYIPKKELRSLPREVRREPFLALDGGSRGLELIFKILQQAPYFLKPRGWLLMEIGKGQSPEIKRCITKDSLYQNLRFIKDFSGIDRVLAVQKK